MFNNKLKRFPLLNPITILTISVWALAFIFIYFITINSTYVSDDWCYGFTSRNQLVSISDFFQSISYQYFQWSGRILVYSLILLFLKYNFFIWILINSSIHLALYLLVIGISRKITAHLKFRPVTILLLSAITLTLFSNIDITTQREVFFWLTGSITYLWPTAVLFFFFLKLCDHYQTSFIKKREIFTLFFCAAILASSQEQVAIISLLFSIGFCFTMFYRKLPNRYVVLKTVMVILFFLVIQLAAPGNFKRFNLEINNQNASSILSFEHQSSELQNKFWTIFSRNDYRFVFLLLNAGFIITAMHSRNKKIKKVYVVIPLIFLGLVTNNR
jgi:hypothetical protein